MAQRSGGWNLSGIVGHGAESVGDHVEEVSVGLLSQAVAVVGGRTPVAAAHDHAVAAAGAVVTGRAVDVVALLAAEQQRLGDRHRKLVGRLAVGALAGVEQPVGIEMAARHGAFGEGAGGASVGEEIAGPQGRVLRLVLHVLAAGGERGQR